MKMANENHRSDNVNVNRRDWLAGAVGWTALFTATGLAREATSAEPSASEQPLPFQLKDFRQVAFVVKDIEASSRQFANALGMKPPNVITTDPVGKAHTVYRGRSTPARAKLAFFSFGSIAIELIEPIGGPSTWKEALDKNGEGIHHIAFRVENMDTALAALGKKGFETIQTGDFTGGSYAYVDTTPALKTVVELLTFE
jgi:4-hydroxyphenylpyruvate dioxygenase-like putative hemolysin